MTGIAVPADQWYASRGLERRKGWVADGIAYLPLTKGRVALLSPAFLPEAEKYNWCYSHGYAVRNHRGCRIYLHWFVLAVADALVDSHIDHINGNPLDNRIENLRFVERSENQINRGLQTNNRSGYRGVSQCRGRWVARIKRRGLNVHLGTFNSPVEAAAAYDAAAMGYGGRVIRTNLPMVQP